MCNRICLLLLSFFFLRTGCVCADGGVFRPGELWPDNRGEHINAHGGGILYHKGVYYWYGEHKSENSSSAFVGVTCYSSRNLTDWKYRGVALSVDQQKGSDIENGCILERPKVIYNPRTRKFVMWFHLELKGHGYSAARSAVAVSDSPAGPFQFLRSGRVNPYCWPEGFDEEQIRQTDSLQRQSWTWWTPEWRRAVEDGLYVRRDLSGGQMARDMTLFVDDDGTAYHIYSSEDNLTLQVAELSEDYTYHTGRYFRIAPGGQNEAPAIFKRQGRYWLITSGCTGWAPNKARLFTSTDIRGPWQQLPNPCRGEGADLTFGGQGTYVLPVAGKKDAFIFMADIWRPSKPIDARYIWLPIRFEEGKPVLEWKSEWSLDEL